MDINVSAADLKVISTINDIQEAIDNGLNVLKRKK